MDDSIRKIVKSEMEAMILVDFNIHEFCFLSSFRKFVISWVVRHHASGCGHNKSFTVWQVRWQRPEIPANPSLSLSLYDLDSRIWIRWSAWLGSQTLTGPVTVYTDSVRPSVHWHHHHQDLVMFVSGRGKLTVHIQVIKDVEKILQRSGIHPSQILSLQFVGR